MPDNTINAHCSICGKGYHVCDSCLEQKAFKPWRTVVDSIDHYKIYLAIHGYTITKNKEVAKSELLNCNLSELENFNTEVKNVIKEIMTADQKSQDNFNKKRKSNLPKRD